MQPCQSLNLLPRASGGTLAEMINPAASAAGGATSSQHNLRSSFITSRIAASQAGIRSPTQASQAGVARSIDIKYEQNKKVRI